MSNRVVTFRDFLRLTAHLNSRYGDFAGDALADSTFPHDIVDAHADTDALLREIDSYLLYQKGACSAALDAAAAVVGMYRTLCGLPPSTEPTR
jgi:hypothetical protein